MATKFLSISLLTLSISFLASAQRFDWSTSAGYPAIANGYLGAVDLAADGEGNVYTFDYANLNQVCQGDTIEVVSPGSNLFVYKFSPDGNLIWGKAFGAGSGGGSVTPLNLEIGPDNSLYTLVHINASNIVTEDSIFQVSAPSNIILSINENGNINWVQSANFSCPACLMLEVANDRIYYQAGQSRIESMEFDQTPDTNYTFYFDPGTAIFTLPFLGSAVFSNGDILLAGLQAGDASFIEGDTLFQVDNPFLYRNISYVRLTPDLQPVWANTFGSLHDPETHFIPMAIDANDQIYTAWEVLDTISIAGTTVLGDFNAFAGAILSMNEIGSPLWLSELESNSALQPTYLFFDEESNKIWLTGISSTPTTIGDVVVTPGVNGSPILASFNSEGVFSNQITLNELPGGSKGKCIAKGLSGQLYLGGNLNNNSEYTINCLDYPGAKGLYVASFLDVPQNPPTPEIISEGITLTASPEFEGTIQWFLDGEAISGANEQTLEVNQDGNYSVVYSYEFGCEAEAVSEIVFISTAINKINLNNISFYPNPASDIIFLNDAKSIESVEIYDSSGRIIFIQNNPVDHINVEQLCPGMYYLKLICRGQINQTGKLILN
ncbi:MAG: T9SS type A sorting domain-containing protein [Bacteroidia bacterium]